MRTDTAIALRDIYKSFGATEIIRGVSLEFHAVNVTESLGRTVPERPLCST
jgi:ABC-type histidine transport system ATPase subunit